MTDAVPTSVSSVESPDGAPERPKQKRSGRKRIVFGALSLAIIVATFAFFLPKIADYASVWDVVKTLTWKWVVVLALGTALNLVTFAPPWMVALPGLRFRQAFVMTQASTALSIIAPAGAAVGMAGSWGMLRSWGYAAGAVTRAVTLTGIWNQLVNLVYPVVALFLLKVNGGQTALLGPAAFIGVAVLGVVIALLVLVLYSESLARDVGDAVARFVSWAKSRIRRGPVTWSGESFARFRNDAVELLRRRWHLLTLASFAGSLTVFLLLVLSLRAVGVTQSQVTLSEAFAAWALVRIIGTIPITPGGIGVVELGLTTALVAFGGNNAGVVAAVLIYRFLTVVPTLVLGGLAALTWRWHRPSAADVAEAGEASLARNEGA
jgi:putative heme transporter